MLPNRKDKVHLLDASLIFNQVVVLEGEVEEELRSSREVEDPTNQKTKKQKKGNHQQQ